MRGEAIRRIGCILLALSILSMLVSCGPREPESAEEPTTLAIATEPTDGLALIALDQGFFAQAGLAVKPMLTASGKEALAALRAGKVELAFVAETPIVFDAFGNTDLKILAQVGRNHDEMRIVARRDRGITNIADLRGRRVGTQEKSSAHFFLYLALLRHRLTMSDIVPVYLRANELPDALARGDIDAFAMREPQVSRSVARLGERAVVFAEPGLYFKTFHLVATDATLKARPGLAEKVLHGLLLAEDYIRRQPQAAHALIAARVGIDKTALDAVWPAFRLELSLDQVLIVSLLEEGRWAVEAGMAGQHEPPDWLGLIDPVALTQVSPDTVHFAVGP